MFKCVLPLAALSILCAPCILSAQPMPSPMPGAIHAAPHGFQMRDVLDRLSPHGQMVFRNEWLTVEHQEAPQRKALTQAAEQNVLAAMNAEPFDGGALRRAYADQRNISSANQRQRQEHLVDILKQLSPMDRHLIVDQLNTMRGH